MAINFDALPTNNPNAGIEDGIYRGKIIEAVMRTPKDATKAPYLNVTVQLYNAKGGKCGRLYDRFFDSEHALMMFKLGQFIRALGLDLTGAVLELKDLAKLIVNKELCIDVVNKENDRTPGRKFPEANVFGNEIYWHISKYAELINEEPALIEAEATAAPLNDNPFVDDLSEAPFDTEDEEY